MCFSDEPKLRTVIWEFAGERIPGELLDVLKEFREGRANGSVATELSELLSVDELTALDTRIDELLRVGVFPEPGAGRPYPWPPV